MSRIIADLYAPNAAGYIRELRLRTANISAQIELTREGGDFQETLRAYLAIVTASLEAAEKVHAANLDQIATQP